jgi:hypothetical protein
MPEVCRFLGIIITMYFNDHNPPHFHVRYGEHRAVLRIQPLMLLDGNLPPRVLGLVMEWAGIRQHELLDNWTLLGREGRLIPIEPLA